MKDYGWLIVYVMGCIIILFLEVCVCSYLIPLKYKDKILFYAQQFNLSTDLVCAVVNAESGYNPLALSQAGAQGLMQLMPSTAQYLADKLNINIDDIYDIDTNLRLGCYYLSFLINKYKNTTTALCAYNAGPNSVDGWLKNQNYSQNGKDLTFIPYKETRDYIRKIDIFRTFYINIYNF